MILQKLLDYAATLDLPPAMYDYVPVKYVINIDQNGRYIGSDLLDGDRKANDRGKKLLAPTLVRAMGIKPKLLVDNGEYVLGIPQDEQRSKRTKQCHEQFVELIKCCANKTNNAAIKQIVKFYQIQDCRNVHIVDEFDASMNITFRVNGELPFQDRQVQQFWSDYTAQEQNSGENIMCHICGNNPAEERMPAKVKRIPEGQAAGTALISANYNAFESYGLVASKVGPTCRDCAERFTFALNHLLADEDSHLTVGKQVYVFWSRGQDFYPAKILHDPDDFFGGPDLAAVDDPAKIRALFLAAFGGKEGTLKTDVEPFYAAAFSAAGGRVVVRDWLETTIPDVKTNLAAFFTCCFHKYQQRPYGIYALAAATVRDANKDLPARTVTQLLNTALKGTRLPEDLLYQAIKRAKAEQAMTAPRAALIKLYYLSNSKYKEKDMIQLNPSNREPAYLCGRLLAVLEAIQSAALGKPNATIVDRYYGTASTAPATVFSTLLTGARHHLSKLRKEKPGKNVMLEKQLQEITGGLTAFPKVLTMEEQGKFALGYYHQKREIEEEK